MQDFPIPTSPEDQKKIMNAMTEATDCLLRIESEKAHIKDIVDMIFENYKIPKKYISKTIRVLHNNNFDKVVVENSTLETFYEVLTKKKQDSE